LKEKIRKRRILKQTLENKRKIDLFALDKG